MGSVPLGAVRGRHPAHAAAATGSDNRGQASRDRAREQRGAGRRRRHRARRSTGAGSGDTAPVGGSSGAAASDDAAPADGSDGSASRRAGVRRRLPRAVILHGGHGIQSLNRDSVACQSAPRPFDLTRPGFNPEPNAYSPTMHVGITGASGLIGTALTSHLRANGHDVTAFVRRPPPSERSVGIRRREVGRRRSRTTRCDRAPRGRRHRRPPLDRRVQAHAHEQPRRRHHAARGDVGAARRRPVRVSF